MKLAGRLAALALVMPLAVAGAAGPEEARVIPGDNLVVQGIPPVPASLAQEVARYTEFRGASLHSWHPVRREMLIGTRFAETNQIHLVRQPGGARTQLTFFADGARGALWQPVHGRYFVFRKDSGGGEWFQLYRYDVAGGAVTLLTDGKSRNNAPVWDRAGRRIAYTSTRRNGRDWDLYTMDPADPASDRLLTAVEGGGWEPAAWAADGRQIALVEFVSANESRLWLVDATTGSKRLVPVPPSSVRVAYGGAQFSRDGRRLYVSTDRDFEFQRLAWIDLADGQHHYLTSHIPWDVDAFALSDDGRRIAFLTNESGVARLRLLDTTSGRERLVPGLPPGVIYGLAWHANSRDVGFAMTSARSPSAVYSLDAASGRLTRWTESESAVDVSGFAEAQTIRWPSFDGRAISGFLFAPPARFTGKRPVIIDIHGGPEGQSRPWFQGRNNYWLNELGIALILPNVRGSSGYGKTFLTLDDGYRREDSYQDIAALLDWIRTDPRLDADRVLVTGGSYGGHMTLAVATNYPERICCAIDVVGISNLVTFLERTEAYRRDLRRVEYGDERDPKMREFLQRIAPLNKAGDIRKPLFVVQGRNDPRVPHTEATQMVETARLNGTPVWFLMANDEGHGFAKRKNRDFDFYARVLFVREFLLK